MIKNWQPAPTKNLVNGIPVKKRQKLSQTNAMNSHSSWEDVRGLAWVFSEDDWS